jgi:3-dehydroquinate dehydratase II
MKVLIINGPNLNLLGKREPQIYGYLSFEEYFEQLKSNYKIDLSYFQSNIEGEIINKIQESTADGIILNAGGYTHTSVSIRDAISSTNIPVIEVHISNLLNREEFRHSSLIGGVCIGSIMGFGLKSYELALEFFKKGS